MKLGARNTHKKNIVNQKDFSTEKNNKEVINFSGKSISQQYYRNEDFSEDKILDSNFYDVCFENCNLKASEIKESYFDFCEFTNVDFSNSVLKLIQFKNCIFIECDFSNTIIINSSFEKITVFNSICNTIKVFGCVFNFSNSKEINKSYDI